MKQPATTIDSAYWDQLWNHDADVWSEDDAAYVPRQVAHDGATKPVHLRIGEHLLRARGVAQYLLTGQVGAGKSTELHRVVHHPDVAKRFQIVVIDAASRLNLTRFVDVRFLLVAIAEGLATAAKAVDADAPGGQGFALTRAQAVREWIRVLGDRHGELPDPSQVDGRAFLDALSNRLLGVRAELQSDDKLRKRLLDAEVSQVADLVAQLAEVLARVSERDVLVVVDDTDKIRDAETANHLFHTHLQTLRTLPFRWVVTMPYALRFDVDAQIPTELVIALPNIKVVVADAPNVLLPTAADFFTQLLSRLVDLSLVDAGFTSEAALMSGGIPREFLRVAHRAFGMANDLHAPRVGVDHLVQATSELRREIQPLHADPAVKRQLELVRLRTTELRPEQRRLMGTLLVIEYSNGAQWYDVHPLLAPEYDQRLQARARRLGVEPNDRHALAADLAREIDGDPPAPKT